MPSQQQERPQNSHLRRVREAPLPPSPAVTRSRRRLMEGRQQPRDEAQVEEQAQQEPSQPEEQDQQNAPEQGNIRPPNMCVVCLVNRNTLAVVPCFHTCLCESCGPIVLRTSNTCPSCRGPIERLQRIFLA